MDMDTDLKADNGKQLQVEVAADSPRHEFTAILPVTRDNDGSYTPILIIGHPLSSSSIYNDENSETVSCAEVRQENLEDLNQKPNDVCRVLD